MGGPDFSAHQVGPYFLTDILGVGAAGSVYRAVDATSRHPTSFVVKSLPKAKISPQRRVQLVAEMLYHDAVTGCPHVLTLRDIIEEDLYLFLVLDLCETDMYKAIWKKKVYSKFDVFYTILGES